VLSAFGSAHAVSQTFSIDAYIIAAASPVQSASSCFGLNAVVGEPIAGYLSSTDSSLSARFVAVASYFVMPTANLVGHQALQTHDGADMNVDAGQSRLGATP
jgi:hypothetical protein